VQHELTECVENLCNQKIPKMQGWWTSYKHIQIQKNKTPGKNKMSLKLELHGKPIVFPTKTQMGQSINGTSKARYSINPHQNTDSYSRTVDSIVNAFCGNITRFYERGIALYFFNLLSLRYGILSQSLFTGNCRMCWEPLSTVLE